MAASEDLLTALLNVGLIDIGDSDERHGYLDAAATSLGSELAGDPAAVAPMVLVAMDDSASPDEAVFARAEEAILQKWKMLRQRFKDRPLTLFRIVMLVAVDRAVQSDSRTCAIAALTGVSALRYFVRGNERPVVERAVRSWCAAAEHAAVAAWKAKVSLSIEVEAEDFALPDEQTEEFTAKSFLAFCERAAGPQNARSQALSNPNPHWPNSNPQWSYEFAPRMADALAATANQASKGWQEFVQSGFVESIGQRLSTNLNRIVSGLEKVHTAANLRNELLWWSESLYSPTHHCSYRDLPPGISSLLMARDLLSIAQIPNPGSVHSFFREAVSRASQGIEPRPIANWLEEITQHGKELRPLFKIPDIPVGRVALGHLLQRAVHERINAGALWSRCGIDANTSIGLPELATWYLRDQEAFQMVGE
jgi:GTPase-associated system helical domain